jgi:rhodanese-related sulfurtransferase
VDLVSRKSGGSGEGVDPAEARGLVAQGALLVDVREGWEWAAGRAPGALHMPLDELVSRAAELPRDRTVVVVCRSGNRSAHATAMLRDGGVDAVNLDGGLRSWSAQGLPLVTDGQKAGRVA